MGEIMNDDWKKIYTICVSCGNKKITIKTEKHPYHALPDLLVHLSEALSFNNLMKYAFESPSNLFECFVIAPLENLLQIWKHSKLFFLIDLLLYVCNLFHEYFTILIDDSKNNFKKMFVE